jgi:HlyD family secretion protein
MRKQPPTSKWLRWRTTCRNLQAQLRSELAMYDLKKLELEKIRFESELKRKITELEFQQATIRLENVKRKLESETRQGEIDLEIHKIKIMQREVQIRDAYETLEKLTLYSPNDGVFQVARTVVQGRTSGWR